MKKILLAVLLMSTTFAFSQKINKKGNGYVEIVKVDSLNQTEIYNKLNEWIALNYQSAQDVIQLNTVEKIVIKGNYSFKSAFSKASSYGVRNTLTFSIKDNRYKIDLIPNSMFDKSDMKDTPLTTMTQYFKEIQNFEDFKVFVRKNAIVSMKNNGFSEKRAIKLIDKNNTPEFYVNLFNIKKTTFENWNKAIELTFLSIKDYVSKSEEEDW